MIRFAGSRVAILAAAAVLASPVWAQNSADPFEPISVDLPGRLELHRPNYVMPLTWTDESEGSEDVELNFQISLRHQVGDTPFYLAYTQESYLRWLDEENSRPFREINYSPEAWYRFRPGRLPMDWLGLDVGWEHESNGGAVGESRSWDRVYLRPWYEQGHWRGHLKLWYRIPEDEKDGSEDPTGDDNPEILDYYGHHELRLEYLFTGGSRLSMTTRYAFSENRGALQLQYAWPTPTRESYFFTQLFTGYGESLETFKSNRTRIGIGFALLR
ncbi:MAG: phospholipase A [Halofilum sp. (in: g-proteobacteria)]